MTNDKKGFFSRLQQALTVLSGTEAEQSAVDALPDEPAVLKARIRSLELDLEVRGIRIKAMQQEFDHLKRQAQADRAGAGNAEIRALAKRLAPILSQAPTMRAMHAAGKDVQPSDLLRLFEKVERIVEEAGLEPIGVVKETVPFNSRLHQRMSGGDVSDGSPVRIRFVGYRFQDTILTKAMVSREGEDAHCP